MNPPRLEACYFSDGSSTAWRWRRLAAVLTSSARLHCPDWHIHVVSLPWQRLPTPHGSDAHIANTQKLDYWNTLVQQATDGEQILLIDADTFITRPLDALWDLPFDLAYAVRTHFMHYTINGGVIALRVSARVRDFMARWAAENRAMLADAKYHRRWKEKYGGINQAALGALLELHVHKDLGLHVLTVPCQEWNCEESAWAQFDPHSTRIVHVKGRLRKAVFPSSIKHKQGADVEPLVALWKAEEQRASARREGAA